MHISTKNPIFANQTKKNRRRKNKIDSTLFKLHTYIRIFVQGLYGILCGFTIQPNEIVHLKLKVNLILILKSHIDRFSNLFCKCWYLKMIRIELSLTINFKSKQIFFHLLANRNSIEIRKRCLFKFDIETQTILCCVMRAYHRFLMVKLVYKYIHKRAHQLQIPAKLVNH